MATIQQELVIKARADVANAKQGLASLDQSVDGLASAQEGLKTASNDAAQGLAAEAAAATSAAQATAQAATASNDAAAAARKLGDDAKAAGSGIDEAAGESKKLTKQLKDVGDELDIAAGKMINGIGGPGAIKALGAASIALAGVGQVADAFMKSSEALFKTWGAEGEAAFSLATKKSNDMAGAFAGAILGTDDMYLAAGRLATIFEALNVAAQLAAEGIKKLIQYTPNGQLLKYLFDVTGATEGYSEMVDSNVERIKIQIAKQKEAALSTVALVEPIKTVKQQYEEITKTVDKLIGREEVKTLTERENTIERLKQLQELAKAEERAAQLKAIRDNTELKREEILFATKFQMFKKATIQIQNEFPNLTVAEREPLIAERQAQLNATELPGIVKSQVDAYRADANALMKEMGGVYEVGTQLMLDSLETQIQVLEKEGKKSAATAGGNIGRTFVGGIKKDVEENLNLVGIITDAFKASRKFFTEQFNLMVRGTDEEYQQLVGAPDPMSEADKEYYKKEQAQKDEAFLQGEEIKAGLRKSPEQISKEKSDAAAAQAAAQKAGQDQIKNIQETSGAVLDLAGAFAALGGVQDGVIDKMRQVVDVVIKIIQATQALEAVQAAQAAAKAAQDTAAAIAAGSTAVATAGVGAAATGAAASAGSAVVPILGAVAAVVGLMGSIFGGGSEAPRRDRGGSSKTIYTSAGEAQGAGGDFAYFEGGRQNVTIVTNDAASIRTMQGRLAFVGSRGGSGF
jgi:hypothetical protein